MEYRIFVTDTLKPTRNIQNCMTQNKEQNVLYTQMQIIYMLMQCLNFFQQVDANEQIPKGLT